MWSVKCGVQRSVKYRVESEEWRVWSVKCEVWSLEWKVESVKRRV